MKKFAGYHIIQEIGRGGMGIVFQARQQEIGRTVALKVLLRGSGADEIEIKRFIREAKVTAKLDHPNIVPIYNMGAHQGYYYFAMQFIQGRTFQEVGPDPEISQSTKLEILKKICDAVHYAHEHQVIHRDIKPSNIILDENLHPYLTDFGLAKQLDSKSAYTKTGKAIGTPFYMSPEQVQGDKKSMGSKTDIYSLGVILYVLLCRSYPFECNSFLELGQKILREEPVWPRAKCSEVSIALDAICRKAMAKDPSLRYESAKHMSEDLQRYLNGETVLAQSFSALTFWKNLQGKQIKKISWLLIIPILALLCTILFLFPSTNKKDPISLWKNAKQEYTTGNYHKSLENIDQVLFHKPSFAPALILKAQVLEKQNKLLPLQMVWIRLLEVNLSFDEQKKVATKTFEKGFIEESLRHWQRVEQIQPKPEHQKKIAQCFTLLGNLNQAKATYKKIYTENPRDTDAIIGLAKIQLKQNNFVITKKFLHRLARTELSPQQKFYQHFLSSVLLWHEQKSLNHIAWLSPDTKGEPLDSSLITNLAKIRQELEFIQKNAQRVPSHYYFQKWLEEVETYYKVFLCEQGNLTVTEILDNYRQIRSLHSSQQIFLTQAVVRSLIRGGHWKEAIGISSKASFRFPWVSHLKHLQGISFYEAGDMDVAINKINQAIQLDSWEVTPLYNLLGLLSSSFDQERFKTFLSLGMGQTRNISPITSDFFAQQISPAAYLQKTSPTLLPMSLDMGKVFLSSVIRGSSLDAKKLAANILVSRLSKQDLELCFQEMKTNLTPKQKNALIKVEEIVRKKQQSQAIEQLKQNIIRYYTLEEDFYINEIQQQGPTGEKYLWQIQENDPELMMRFIATQVLIRLGHSHIISHLEKIVHGTNYQNAIIAYAGIQKHQVKPIFLSSNTIKQWLVTSKSQPFCQLLLALYLSPLQTPQTFATLLNDSNPQVSLAAAYRLRQYHKLHESISLSAVNKKLLEWIDTGDFSQRLLAYRIFWSFQGFPSNPEDRRYPFDNQAQEKVFKQLWSQHSKVFINMLDDPEKKIRLVALQTISENYSMFHVLDSKELRSLSNTKQATEKIYQLCQSSAISQQWWGAIALAIVDSSHKGKSIMNDSTRTFFVRTGTIAGTLKGNLYTVFPILREVVNKASDNPTLAEQKFTSILFIFLHHCKALVQSLSHRGISKDSPTKVKFLVQFYESFLKKMEAKHRRSKVASYRLTLCNALTWSGNREHLPFLYRELKKAKGKKEATIILRSISAIIARSYSLEERENFVQKASKWKEWQKKAVAWGFYEIIHHQVITDDNWLRDPGALQDRSYFYVKIAASDRYHSQWQSLLRNINQVAPTPEYAYLQANILFQLKNFRGAQEITNNWVRKLNQSEPVWKDFQLLQNQIYQSQNRWDDALATLEAVKEKHPRNYQVYEHMGNLAHRQHKLNKAKKLFWQSYYHRIPKPDAEHILFLVAKIHIAENQTNLALELLKGFYELKYTVRRRHLIQHFPSLANNQWVQQLRDY